MGGEYNGWRNVETWRVQLHLQNNDELRTVAKGLACYAVDVAGVITDVPADRVLADRLRDYVSGQLHGMLPATDVDGLGTLLADTVDAALGRVDWEQIATAWLEPAAGGTT